MELNRLINDDCMNVLKDIPDNYFELAIVDPPYGGGGKADGTGLRFHGGDRWDKYQQPCGGGTSKVAMDDLAVGGTNTDKSTEVFPSQFEVNGKDIGEFPNIEIDDKLVVTKNDELGVHFHGRGRSKKYQEMHDSIEVGRTGGAWASKYGNKISSWDVAPSQEYFEELFRVSKNQIIWGGNYFSLPPTRCFLIWEKLTISENFTMAMCEYAWTSFNDNAKLFKYAPQDKERFHPTQKPVALYEWVISRYAKDGDKILDTHAGSGSCLVAAYNLGHEYLGIELDPYYFQKAEERLETIKSQMRLF